MWLNEYDVDEAVFYAERAEMPNALTAAVVLRSLVGWVNANSDGWPYWQAPAKASKKLQEALYKRFFGAWHGRIETDLTDAELKAILIPVKSFRTKHNATFMVGG